MFFFSQVSEVLSQDKCRLSLSGWFHGTSLERPPRYKEPAILRSPHLPRDVSVKVFWEIYIAAFFSIIMSHLALFSITFWKQWEMAWLS